MTELPESPKELLTQAQLDDLGELFARSLSRETIIWLATSVLGRTAVQAGANEIGDSASFARRIVKVMNDEGRMQEAILLLLQEGRRGSPLVRHLNSILRGKRLDDDEALQAFADEYEPFFTVNGLEESLKRIKRAVCAIGLGGAHKMLRGTGFLIGPDLVMTNFHVIQDFLDEREQSIVPNAPGDQILCFFDYFMEPPPKIPPGTIKHASTVIAAAEPWLVHARRRLPFDGTLQSPATVKDEYDYVIIRLAKPIGSMPTRQGGGTIRGWLKLPDAIDVLQEKRVMVFQHPEGFAQMIDIGKSVGMDTSNTRIWYTVKTAKGSSGGAAVDADGELFALHNAEVCIKGTPLEHLKNVNQGVRIDKIAADLAACRVALGTQSTPPTTRVQFWSLNDDPTDPRPIVGRSRYRDMVSNTHTTGEPKVVVVTGPPGSGVQFSTRILQRTLGPQTPVVVFSSKDLETLGPRDFLRALVDGLGIKIRPGDPIPPAKDTENLPRWLRLDLPGWLKRYLDDDEGKKLRPYPMWVVMNATVPPGGRMLWAENLKDFVATLIGARDAGQAAVDIPQLRWLFLGQRLDSLPVTGVPYAMEDLTVDQGYETDFLECLQLAWSSVIEREEEPLNEKFLRGLAAHLVKNAGTDPPRKFLANTVRNIIIEATKLGTHV